MHGQSIEMWVLPTLSPMVLAQTETPPAPAPAATPSASAPAAPAAAAPATTATPAAASPSMGAKPSTQDLISGTASPTGASTGVSGGGTLGPSGGGGGGGPPPQNPMGSMVYLLPLMIGFIILTSVLSGRKEKKRQANLMASLKPGDRVLAAGGLLAQVDKVKDDEVTLKIDENSSVKVKVLRSAIQQILRPSETTEAK